MNDKEVGKVVFISSDRGFGFIKIESRPKNVFFHAKDLRHINFEQIRKGDSVEVEAIEETEKGFNAGSVYLIS